MNSYLFIEGSDSVFGPLVSFRSAFALRTGIYSELERCLLRGANASICYEHPDQKRQKIFADLHGFALPAGSPEEGATRFDSKSILGFDILDRVAERIESDLSLWLKEKPDHKRHAVANTMGRSADTYLHPTALIGPGVVLDTRSGPIVVDADATVTAFSYLAGPLYIGPESRVDNLRISNSVVGRGCRLGGEIENSIFQDFSNKHHEGFIGHSLIGSWVNLGALTTTSDLKNNYGKIRVQARDGQTRETNRIKFGSIIGDYAKTAIGTMLNTGTIVDCGANVFGGSPGKYVPALAWGLDGQKYERDRFVQDAKTIMARRKQEPHSYFEELIASI